MTEETKFRSQYLNQWVVARNPWIPPTVWNECHDPQVKPEGAGVVTVDTTQNGDAFSAVWVAPAGDYMTVRAYRDDKPRRVWDWVASLPEERRVFVGASIDGLQPAGMGTAGKWGAREVRRYLPGARRLIIDRLIRHDGNDILSEQMLRASLTETQTGPAFRVPDAPIDLTRNYVVAAGIAQRYKSPILFA